ncbi:MAG: choice-of-anchor Q domain-containing protein, partial [Phycisphaerales bacterium]|nr:choice-of-anchor Q domain-containing protein [Phycisphaerales bacterium]
MRNEYAKLTASDGAADDLFGTYAAISGDTMVVGTANNNLNFAGAYVFVRSAGIWTQQARLSASDGTDHDGFGMSVAVSGDNVFVGAWYDDIGPNVQGSVYVFVRPGGGWADMTETAKLTASDGAEGDYFGSSLAVSGDTLVVGAFFDDIGANTEQGSAYVFIKPVGGWINMTQTAKLTASDGAFYDFFNGQVGVFGDTVVVGAALDDIGLNADQGSAYVFVKPGGGWADMTQTAKLTASDGVSQDVFGISVAISGDTVYVGAYLDDIGPNANQGSVYVFVKPDVGWPINMTQTAKLTASDGVSDDLFGRDVAVSGDYVVIGAPGDDIGLNSGQGSAYVFVKPGGGWSDMSQAAALAASDGAASDFLGVSVAVSGDSVVVGAYTDDIGLNLNQGSVYVFTLGVLFVDANHGPAGLNDGSSWVNAFRYLNDALAAGGPPGLPPGSEIWVAKGTYKPDRIPPGNRAATFQLQSGVALYGGFDGTETVLSQRDPTLNTTILSGDLLGNDTPVPCTQNSPDCDSFGGLCVNGFCIIKNNNLDNSFHVVTGSGTDATAILDGFTITAGMVNAPQPLGGAGMRNNNGSPTVTNCTFSGNSAFDNGGGLLNVFNSSPTITNCTFRGNSGSLLGFGGGMYNYQSSPSVTNCTFSGNSAGTGGGMFNLSFSSPTVTNCTFSGNSGESGGGGMYNGSSNPAVTNCTFSANSARLAGGGIRNDENSSPTITNCTFSANRAIIVLGGGMFNYSGSSPTVINSILWGNSDSSGMGESAQVYTDSGTPVVNYSIVQGGWTGAGGTGVVNANPLFFDPDGADNAIGTIDDDLRLRTGSPAIDAGNNASVPADTLDLDGDLNVAEPIPFDLAGNARFVGTVDIGAYEYFPDCNNNGIDDATDIINLTSTDCNSTNWPSNVIPDECDIASCVPPNPGCGDCNSNRVPDGCDIGGVSQDTTPID